MSLKTRLLVIASLAVVGSAASAQGSYAIEFLENIEPWPAGRVDSLQAENEGYALVYRRTANLTPRTVAVINGNRHELPGFEATDMNAAGQMCGRLALGTREVIGVKWNPASGFSMLKGGPLAQPNFIGSNGDVGGALGWWNNPCLWRNGEIVSFPGVSGNVCFVIENSGLIAGHLRDGGHGTYPWLATPHGKAWWLGLDLSLIRALPDNLILGHRASIGGGSGRILNMSSGTQTVVWQGNSNYVRDMNDSLIGIGVTFHGREARDLGAD
jgi:hypothetical protein